MSSKGISPIHATKGLTAMAAVVDVIDPNPANGANQTAASCCCCCRSFGWNDVVVDDDDLTEDVVVVVVV